METQGSKVKNHNCNRKLKTTNERRALVCLLFLTSCFLLTQEAFAGSSPTAAEIIKNVRDSYNQTNDAIIKFTQTVLYPVSQISKTTTGTLYLKKGNRYRIESEDRTIITDGKTSWIYSPASKQVIIDNFRDDKNTVTPDKFLVNIPSDYFAVLLSTQKSDSGNTYTLRLTPKSDNSFIRSIKIIVKSDWTVSSAEISDMNDSRYTYTVDELKVNPGLPDSEFSFVPPKNVQVIDLRRH